MSECYAVALVFDRRLGTVCFPELPTHKNIPMSKRKLPLFDLGDLSLFRGTIVNFPLTLLT